MTNSAAAVGEVDIDAVMDANPNPDACRMCGTATLGV